MILGFAPLGLVMKRFLVMACEYLGGIIAVGDVPNLL